MSEIDWSSPAPRYKESPMLDELVAQLCANPGQWARLDVATKLGKSIHNQGTSISKGFGRWQPLGSFESTSRTEGRRRYVYVRYIGESEAAS